MTHPKRIGILSGNVSNGITYQRGHLPLRNLKHKYEFVPISLGDMEQADLYYLDALIIFHPYHEMIAKLIKRCKVQLGIPVIIDIDDLLTQLPSDHPEFSSFIGGKVPDILKFADHVVVSTDYLHKVWGHLNKNITVIENTIDVKRYKGFTKAPKPYHAGFVVGWTGSQTHRPDLYNTGFITGLTEFMREHEDVRAYFHLLCPQPLLDEFGARVIFNEKGVEFLDYPAMCYNYPFDVCAVPLTNHPFNHAKSDLRLLDMAPFKIPLIASPVSQFVRHSPDKLITAPDGLWLSAFEQAYKDRQALSQIADRASDYVLQNRHSHVGSDQWDHVLEQVCLEGSI